MTTKVKPGGIAQNKLKKQQLEHLRLGKVTYTDEDLICFAQGLLGFEKKKYYILVANEDYYPFVWMISTDDPTVSFVMANPLIFMPEYNPNISKRELNEIEVENPQSLVMYVIITLNRDPLLSTANLSGPILINMEKKIGKQLVLLDDQYSTKHRILNPE